MSFGITVNNDSNHTLTFDKNTLARRNEANVSVTVTVPAAVFALGSFAYVDFLLPDGTAYYKGPYDPSSGSFTFTLGSADVILQQDGRMGIQFVLRDAAVNQTVVWKSELKYALVGASADATAQALTGIPAPATFPVTFPASNVSLTDAGTYFASPDVEDALQEVGSSLATNAGDITDLAGAGRTTETVKANADAIALKMNLAGGVGNPFTAMPYVGTAPVVESGSNANGHYIKFADGTMICRGSPALSSLAITTASGSIFTGTATYTFAAEFIAAPAVSVSFDGGNYIWTSINPASATTFVVVAYSSISQTTSTGVFHYIAVGRWKA